MISAPLWEIKSVGVSESGRNEEGGLLPSCHLPCLWNMEKAQPWWQQRSGRHVLKDVGDLPCTLAPDNTGPCRNHLYFWIEIRKPLGARAISWKSGTCDGIRFTCWQQHFEADIVSEQSSRADPRRVHYSNQGDQGISNHSNMLPGIASYL